MLMVLNILLSIFGAYSMFCSGMNYMSAYCTGVLYPFKQLALIAGIVGVIALLISQLLYLA